MMPDPRILGRLELDPFQAVNSRMKDESPAGATCVHAPLLIGNSIFNKCTQIDFQLGAFQAELRNTVARTHTHMYLHTHPHPHLHRPLTPALRAKLFNLRSVVFRASNIPGCQKYLSRDFHLHKRNGFFCSDFRSDRRPFYLRGSLLDFFVRHLKQFPIRIPENCVEFRIQ